MSAAFPGTSTRGTRPAIPRAATYPLLGNAPELLRDPLDFFLRSYLAHGPIYRAGAFGRNYIVMAGPTANAFLLQGGERYLDNRAVYGRLARELQTDKYPMATAGAWHRHLRRTLKPAFSREAIAGYLPRMVEVVKREARTWATGRSFPVLQTLQLLVADQLGLAMANRPIGARLPDAVRFARTATGAGLGSYPAFLLWSPRYRRAKASMFAFMQAIVAEHRAREPGDGREPDLVDLLLRATDAEGRPFADADVIANAQMAYSNSLLYAAPACAFLLYTLLKQPDLLEDLVAEVDTAFADGPPDARRLRQMPLLYGAMMESMRLHPIALATPRLVVEPFEFDGRRVDAGQAVLVVVTVCHYLPELFPDPYRFDAGRYAPPRNEHRQSGAHVPFGLGSHACLATGLVHMLVMATVATLLHTVRFELDPPDYRLRKVVNPFPEPEARMRVRVVEQRLPPQPPARVPGSLDRPLVEMLPTVEKERLHALLAGATVRRYTPGTVIIHQGTPADRFYVVSEGEVEVTKAQPGREPRVVDVLGPGQYFGEIGLLHGVRRTATVTAVRPVVALVLEREQFLALVAEADLTSGEIASLARRRAITAELALALPRLDKQVVDHHWSRFELLRYPAGATIIREGDPPERFYILTGGEADVLNHRPDGGELVIDHLEPGDYFGEIGILDDRPRTATVRAYPDGDVEVMALDRASFLELVDASKPAGDEIAMVMAQRLIRLARAGGANSDEDSST